MEENTAYKAIDGQKYSSVLHIGSLEMNFREGVVNLDFSLDRLVLGM